MAWLQGTSTWANIESDIPKLLCGEISDGVGASAGADAWVRDIDTSHPTIRTPASQDISLPAMSGRAGYWALLRSGGVAGQSSGYPGATPLLTVCQQTNPMTNTTAMSHGRALIILYVQTVNTVASNYSTAQLNCLVFDADNVNLLVNTTLSVNAAGVCTVYNGCTVTVSDPSGFLATSAAWVRGFTGTYLYGIDWWQWYPQRTAAPTFTAVPPGTAGTDYDLIDQVPVGYGTTQVSGSGGQNNWTPGFMVNGACFSGMGCKTATSVNGTRYTTNVVTIAAQKIAMVKNVTGLNGQMDLIFGPAPVDAVVASGYGNGIRASHCTAFGAWLRFATTSASVTTAMTIQYWICVKPTGFTITLNADPGFTGKMGCAGVWKMDNVADTTYDIQPWVCTGWPADMSAGGQSAPTQTFWTPRAYWAMRRCQDSSWGTRDWQTGFMRTDFLSSPAQPFNQNTAANQYMFAGCPLIAYGTQVSGSNATGQISYNPVLAALPKPTPDGFWDLYGVQLLEGNYGTYPGNTNPQGWTHGQFQIAASMFGNTFIPNTEQSLVPVRGSLSTFTLMIPAGGYGNGDEITDSVGGAKYLLAMPDYAGPCGRVLTGSNIYSGAVAIRENL